MYMIDYNCIFIYTQYICSIQYTPGYNMAVSSTGGTFRSPWVKQYGFSHGHS